MLAGDPSFPHGAETSFSISRRAVSRDGPRQRRRFGVYQRRRPQGVSSPARPGVCEPRLEGPRVGPDGQSLPPASGEHFNWRKMAGADALMWHGWRRGRQTKAVGSTRKRRRRSGVAGISERKASKTSSSGCSKSQWAARSERDAGLMERRVSNSDVKLQVITVYFCGANHAGNPEGATPLMAASAQFFRLPNRTPRPVSPLA